MYLRSSGSGNKNESEFYSLDNYNKRQKITPPPPTKSAEDLKLQQEAQDAEDLKLLYEAREAVPALFAKPGDCFEWSDCYGEVHEVEYVGRNTIPSKVVEFQGESETTKEYTSPKKGWLIFRGGGLDNWRCTLRDSCRAWPLCSYSQYNEEGEMIEDTICIPPGKAGHLTKSTYWRGESDEEEKGKEKSDGSEEEIVLSAKLLQEVRKAAPALVAKPGDKFIWENTYCRGQGVESCAMKYVGRNNLRPTSKDGPQVGWLVFRAHGENHIDNQNEGIRDGIHAWPICTYSHYSYKILTEATTLFELALWKAKIDEAEEPVDRQACRVEMPGPVKETTFAYLGDILARRIKGRLCIPPSKCGALQVIESSHPYFWHGN